MKQFQEDIHLKTFQNEIRIRCAAQILQQATKNQLNSDLNEIICNGRDLARKQRDPRIKI